MTGYQEILTDPFYAADRHLHSPHIGNVGVDDEESRSSIAAAAMCGRAVFGDDRVECRTSGRTGAGRLAGGAAWWA